MNDENKPVVWIIKSEDHSVLREGTAMIERTVTRWFVGKAVIEEHAPDGTYKVTMTSQRQETLSWNKPVVFKPENVFCTEQGAKDECASRNDLLDRKEAEHEDS